MKRKLIFVILVAMILAPMSTFAADASVYLDYNRTDSSITVKGSGFDAGEMVSIFSGYASELTFASADGLDQAVANADGTIEHVILTADFLEVGDTYYVQVGAASLAAPILDSVYIGGMSAILQAPLRFTVSMYDGVVDIDADYPGAFTVTSSNPGVLKVLTPSGNTLSGIQVQGMKTGTAMLQVKAGDQVATISVTVTF